MGKPADPFALNGLLRNAAAGARAGLRVRAVLGNEAADLDSLASAVGYAALPDRGRDGEVCLPVLPIPRADFGLRPEAVWLFREAGLEERALVFLDEIDLQALQAAGRLSLVLVDHNRLAAAHGGRAAVVREIIDHHADEGLYPGAAREIAPVGSCATLVAERVLRSGSYRAMPGAGLLLLGAILLDTVNLDPAARRVTPRDERAARRLLEITGAEQDGLFERLRAGRFDVSALSSRDLLRRDYKGYAAGALRYGISSAPLSLADWAARDPRLGDSIREHAGNLELDLLLVMTAYMAGAPARPELRRELTVYSPEAALARGVAAFLGREGPGLAPLEIAAAAAAGRIAFYTQADSTWSRKKLQPLLAGYLTAMGEGGQSPSGRGRRAFPGSPGS